jgi:hypothetical protein
MCMLYTNIYNISTMPIITQPHLGYYTVGNINFRNVVHAILYASKTKQEMSWTFNDFEYNNHDWTTEPTESLETLYGLRAKELREKYDHIAICYTGGSDSHNALMSFFNNGLHVDEVISAPNHKGGKNLIQVDGNKNSVTSALFNEYELQTLPRLEYIRTHFSKTKITSIDLTEHLLNRYASYGDGSWVEKGTGWLGPTAGGRWDISNIPEFRKTLETDKKICYIVGVEKPRCGIKDGDWYMAFNDKPTHFGPDHLQLPDFPNTNLEFFYWGNTITSMRLLTKQSFVLKHYVESRPNLQPHFEYPLTPHKVMKIHEPIMRNVLYPTWFEDLFFQAEKPVQDWTIEYDDWFFQHTELKKYQDIWKDGIKHIVNQARDFVMFDENKVPIGFKKFYKLYRIGKFNRNINVL